jgi:hypothetical protein
LRAEATVGHGEGEPPAQRVAANLHGDSEYGR